MCRLRRMLVRDAAYLTFVAAKSSADVRLRCSFPLAAAMQVKISNLMRVLGAEAVMDPTRVEAEVRGQMAERQAAHEDHNLSRKLTPAERKAKKLRHLFGSEPGAAAVGGAGGLDVGVAVYRCGSLADKRLLFKVDVNARENHLSGVSVDHPAFGLVVVEGGAKGLKRYKKLMLSRIDWAKAGREEEEDGEDADEAGAAGGGGAGLNPANYCVLAWEGKARIGPMVAALELAFFTVLPGT